MPLPPSPEENNLTIPFEDSEPRVAQFPIVGIGASAGGLEAFSQLLGSLPVDTGLAFVLVQHLDPSHKSELTNLLSPATAMPVREVADGMRVEPNHVYVIPPNTKLEFAKSTLHLKPREHIAGPHLTIDDFFKSLAIQQSRLSVGVVLSGTGSDGSEGLKAIKSACGITFAQDEGSAKYATMPRNAAATGIVDFILPPARIGEELARIARDPYVVPLSDRSAGETLPDGDEELKQVFSLLLRGTGVDFTHYKAPTMRRRIGRRMVVHRLGELREYTSYLADHPEEVQELFRDVLINVTSFFRDPESFSALKATLVELAKTNQLDKHSFRAWVPGCSTGEEAYSLSILIHEVYEEAGLRPRIQIFGTDISEGALSVARIGAYPARVLEEISPERLGRYFNKVDGTYQIDRTIRETCVFARHDLTSDTPFSRLDLVSCRNVMIYLDGVLQRAVLPTFHYALNSAGVLFLGSAETTGVSGDLFSAVDNKHKIYARKPGASKLDRLLTWPSKASQTFTQLQVASSVSTNSLVNVVDRAIRDRYAPDAAVINRQWQIFQFRGQTGFYLEPAPGEASFNLLRMARGDLPYALRELVNEAIERDVFVERRGIRIEQGGEIRDITIEVTPLNMEPDGERFYLVAFRRDVTHFLPIEPQPAVPVDSADERIAVLERELATARRFQQGVAEEHDAAMEEARALNEELRSANEELQSSNEELATTKEETQSANEELTTVNEELDTRNQELRVLNDDLNNLFSAVGSPVLKVDRDLFLRRFTPAAERLGIRPGDLNHPVRDLHAHFGDLPEIEPIIRDVIESLNVRTHDFRDSERRWWSLSVRPYRTTDHRIDGAVLTFTDTDALQSALQQSERERRYAEGVIETVREPLAILTRTLRVERANASFYEYFRVTAEQTEGQLLFDLGNGQWRIPELRTRLEKIGPGQPSFSDFEVRYTSPEMGLRVILLNGRQITREEGQPDALLLAFEDVTERRRHEEEAREQQAETSRELDRTKEELRALAFSLMHAREEVDRRVARELHDDFSQRLALLAINLEKLRIASLSENVSVELGGLQQRVTDLATDIRDLSHRMHPAILDDLGLVPALRSLAQDFGSARTAPVEFSSENMPPSLPVPHAGAIYRIAQEALNNVGKHAPDAPVRISVTVKANILRLVLRDSGPGFDSSAPWRRNSLGIINMQERAHGLGGEVRIQSQPGQGTVITAEIPLTERGPHA